MSIESLKAFGIVGLLVATALLVIGYGRPAPPIGPKTGNIAPDFSLPDLDGRTADLHDLRGRPVVLVFACSFT